MQPIMIRHFPVCLLVLAAVGVPTALRAESTLDPAAQLAAATNSKDVPSQIELLRRVLEQRPDDVESRTRLVELWSQLGDSEMALATLEEFPSKPPAGLAARTRAAA